MKLRSVVIAYFWLLVAPLLATLGLKGFLLPNHFIDGGVTGISMLLAHLTHKPLPLFILLVNLPFVLIGLKQRNLSFALKSTVAILGLSVFLVAIDIPALTHDKLLAAIFGGLCLGGGIGLTIRGGGVLDGTEVIALDLAKKWHISIGDFILVFNVILFGIASFSLGIEAAMYSIISYFSASKTMDFIVYGLDEHVGVWIISQNHTAIKETVLKELNRGVTLVNGQGGFSGDKQDILFCVISQLEVGKFKATVATIDPNAFIMMHKTSYTFGGLTKKSVISH